MVRRALILAVLGLVGWAAPARALDVRLPACAPADVDTALLAELLVIELGDRALEVRVGASLCDEGREALEIDVIDLATGAHAHDVLTLPSDGDPDARANARAIALAIAERAPRAISEVRAPETPAETPTTTPSSPPPPPAEPEPASALASPREIPTDRVVPVPTRIAPTLGLGVAGRLSPVQPSWLLGLRVSIGASFDATWSLRGELAPSWARATASEGDVDALVTAGAVSLVATLLRTSELALSALARVEGGALWAMGWISAASSGATLHPWITAGLGGELSYAVTSELQLTAEIDASALLWGTRISTWPSGTQIDLSYALFDLALGLRIAL